MGNPHDRFGEETIEGAFVDDLPDDGPITISVREQHEVDAIRIELDYRVIDSHTYEGEVVEIVYVLGVPTTLAVRSGEYILVDGKEDTWKFENVNVVHNDGQSTVIKADRIRRL